MTTRFHLRPLVADMHVQVYSRPLHPELFEVLGFRRLRRPAFTLDLWITTAGHVVSCRAGRTLLTEAIAGSEELPDWGHAIKQRLRGERTCRFESAEGVNYQLSFQVEELSPDQYQAVHRETLVDSSRAALMHAYTGTNRWAYMPVSAIYADAGAGRLSLSAFHTFPEECVVVKTQSLIEFA